LSLIIHSTLLRTGFLLTIYYFLSAYISVHLRFIPIFFCWGTAPPYKFVIPLKAINETIKISMGKKFAHPTAYRIYFLQDGRMNLYNPMVRNFAPYMLRDKILFRLALKDNPPSESAG